MFDNISDVQSTASGLDEWMKGMNELEECYDELGCFGLNYPWLSWSRPIPVLPQPPDVIATKFYLLTRKVMNNVLLEVIV